ncbi:MAG: ferrous iron transport protein A [Solobacterium sp.]|nr:ferrous iron transport protein A [Solobacterium sp.]
MMPLTFAGRGEPVQIMKINGNAEVKQHLADMGFVVGGNVTVISEADGNMIVNIKESRVAIGKEMALKIMI